MKQIVMKPGYRWMSRVPVRVADGIVFAVACAFVGVAFAQGMIPLEPMANSVYESFTMPFRVIVGTLVLMFLGFRWWKHNTFNLWDLAGFVAGAALVFGARYILNNVAARIPM